MLAAVILFYRQSGSRFAAAFIITSKALAEQQDAA